MQTYTNGCSCAVYDSTCRHTLMGVHVLCVIAHADIHSWMFMCVVYNYIIEPVLVCRMVVEGVSGSVIRKHPSIVLEMRNSGRS